MDGKEWIYYDVLLIGGKYVAKMYSIF